MHKYKLAIFDFDGTIADTSEGIFNSIRYTQKMMGLPGITTEQMYSHVGPPIEESYKRNFGLVGEELKRAISFHKEYAVRQGYRELRLYDGIIETLARLRDSGYKTAVATLKAQDTADKILDCFKIRGSFDFVAGAVGSSSKSELVLKCIEKLGCSKAETVLTGDSEYDAIGALNAQVDFIAVTYGFGFKAESDVGYDHVSVCGFPKEIADFLIIR